LKYNRFCKYFYIYYGRNKKESGGGYGMECGLITALNIQNAEKLLHSKYEDISGFNIDEIKNKRKETIETKDSYYE